MFVRDAWYVAAWSPGNHNQGVPAGGLLARVLMTEPLVLSRTGDGTAVAMEDRCRRWRWMAVQACFVVLFAIRWPRKLGRWVAPKRREPDRTSVAGDKTWPIM